MRPYHKKVWTCAIIVTFILFFYTFSFAQTESIKGQVKENTYGYIETNEDMETSIAGVYAAGDVTGGRMQVATAVGSGASAAISAMQYLG